MDKIKLNVGASRIRKVIEMLEGDDKLSFIKLIWPDLSPGLLLLLSKHIDETTVNGGQLELPASWRILAKEFENDAAA